MKSKILLTVCFLIISTVVYGQGYAFKILAAKGTNEVKTTGSWHAIKIGESLKITDELKVPANAYIGLVHISGKPIEVKQAGTYKVADLSAKVSTGTNVLNKYTDFILSRNSAEAKKNRLNATGAAHRGADGLVTVYLPKTSSIYNNDIVVSWESKIVGSYVVKIKNIHGDELMKIETPENTVNFDISDPRLFAESTFLVEVRLTSESSANDNHDYTYTIKRLPLTERNKIKKSLTEIMPEINEGNAMDYLVLAGFYEQNTLMIDALAAYDKAMKLAPDVPTFREYYDSFLLRNHLKPDDMIKR